MHSEPATATADHRESFGERRISTLPCPEGDTVRPLARTIAPASHPVNDEARRTGPLQVRDGVLRRGLALAAPAALEDLARDMAAAEAEGQRQRQDETAEEHAEGDQHHVAPDADFDERGGDREQQNDPARAARQ